MKGTEMAKKSSRNKGRPIAMPETERDYRIASAADTLIRANEIKADRSLMRAVKSELKQRQKAIQKAVKT